METWYKDHVPTAAVNLQGFACERKDRADRIGGGVAFYLKSDLKYKRQHRHQFCLPYLFFHRHTLVG